MHTCFGRPDRGRWRWDRGGVHCPRRASLLPCVPDQLTLRTRAVAAANPLHLHPTAVCASVQAGPPEPHQHRRTACTWCTRGHPWCDRICSKRDGAPRHPRVVVRKVGALRGCQCVAGSHTQGFVAASWWCGAGAAQQIEEDGAGAGGWDDGMRHGRRHLARQE
jgi:hypothetical protein